MLRKLLGLPIVGVMGVGTGAWAQSKPADLYLGQVTSVSELSDVSANDWAFSALQSLVERYGCIEGYPDRTYRGQRALSRYEFAAGLNACLDRINEIIAAGLADKVTKDDLATLQRLQEEFAAELAAIKGRVDSLEKKVASLEGQQFSTTTKLAGEVVFALADTFGERTGRNTTDPTNVTSSYRARLNFNTSFTGKDLLRVRLQAANVPNFNTGLTGTNMTRTSFDTNTNNDYQIDDLFYRFPVGDSTDVWLLLRGFGTENITPPLSPLASDGQASISRFGRFSPTYRIVEGSGLGLSQRFGAGVELALAYRAPNAANPAPNAGLTGGTYGAIAQLTFTPSRDFKFGVHYARTYFGSGGVNLTGSTGSENARQPFGNIATSADTYGFVTQWDVSLWGLLPFDW